MDGSNIGFLPLFRARVQRVEDASSSFEMPLLVSSSLALAVLALCAPLFQETDFLPFLSGAAFITVNISALLIMGVPFLLDGVDQLLSYTDASDRLDSLFYVVEEFKSKEKFMQMVMLNVSNASQVGYIEKHGVESFILNHTDFLITLLLKDASFFLEALPYLSKKHLEQVINQLPSTGWFSDSEFVYDFIYVLNQMRPIEEVNRYFSEVLDFLAPRIVIVCPQLQSVLHVRDERTTLVIKRSFVLENPFESLTVLIEKIDENLGQLPKIRFEGEEGVDYGGLTKDLISFLFEALFSGENPALGECFPYPQISDLVSFEEFEQIGKIMGALIIENPYRCTMGKHIDQGFFDALSQLSIEDLMQQTPSLNTQLTILSHLLSNNTVIDDFIHAMKRELYLEKDLADEEMIQQILESYSQFKPSISALFYIARGIALQMPECWNEKKMRGGEALEVKIQGILSKERVLSALKDSVNSEVYVIDESKQFLIQWIRGTSLKSLQLFVKIVTGKPSLLSQDVIYIKYMNQADGRVPVAHTCFNQLDLPSG